MTREPVARGSRAAMGRSSSSTKSRASKAPAAPPEVLPYFSREVEEGNVEYKWKLVNTSEERLVHLTTQLNWRLNESETGEAIYLIGVKDDGCPEGISDKEFRESMATLHSMAKGVSAAVKGVKTQQGVSGRLAEVVIRREKYRSTAPLELRVAALGNAESGKSTLVGVLTKGSLDNGRGLARMKVFRHNHEVENGRTSSITQHILGFSASGEILNYSNRAGGTPPRSEEIQNQSSKVISFIDLAGHEKYLKTTLSGMVGLSPDYAMLSVPAVAPVGSSISEVGQGVAGDHVGIALALNVPLFVVITKIDLVSEEALRSHVEGIQEMLERAGKSAMLIRTPADMAILEAANSQPPDHLPVPVFLVSNVTGHGLELLRSFFRRLPRLRVWDDARHEPMEVHIDQTFEVEGVGTVLAGTIHRGRVEIGDSVLLGPDRVTGAFQPVTIRSMHVNRVPVRTGMAGQCVTFALSSPRDSSSTTATNHATSSSSTTSGGRCFGQRSRSGSLDECAGSSTPSPRKKQHLKGTVLLSPSSMPSAALEFDAEVVVLSHPTGGRISVNFEAVVHVHTMRQTAKIVSMDRGQDGVAKGETAHCRFRLLYRPEYLNAGMTIVFRSGRTLGIGRITTVVRTNAISPTTTTTASACTSGSSSISSGGVKEVDGTQQQQQQQQQPQQPQEVKQQPVEVSTGAGIR